MSPRKKNHLVSVQLLNSHPLCDLEGQRLDELDVVPVVTDDPGQAALPKSVNLGCRKQEKEEENISNNACAIWKEKPFSFSPLFISPSAQKRELFVPRIPKLSFSSPFGQGFFAYSCCRKVVRTNRRLRRRLIKGPFGLCAVGCKQCCQMAPEEIMLMTQRIC